MRDSPLPVLFGIALIAFSTLLLEVDITRVFAVTLWYYFGFVAISLALLGTGAAGVICFVNPGRWAGEHYRRHMGRFAAALGLLCPVVIWIHLASDFSSFTLHHGLFFLVLGLQLVGFFLLFFCAGMVIAIGLFRFREQVGRFYFFDLAGASLGSLAVIVLLYQYSAPALAFAVSAAAFIAAFVLLAPITTAAGRAVLGALVVASLVVVTQNDRLGLLAIHTVKSYSSAGLQDAETDKVYEQWSPVSRIAVFAPSPGLSGRLRMRVTNDAGAPTSLHRFNGDLSTADWVLKEPTNAGLQLRSHGDSLVIGSGGGMDVLSALRFGNRSITAVEINPVTAELVTGRYADYIGHIFDNPKVSFHVQEGRNFAAGSKDRYDLVTITMIDSWAGAAAGAYMFSENTLYTYEAVRDYYEHLKDDGILSISRYYTWDEALRVVNTYLTYLTDAGVSEPQKQVMVVVEEPRVYRRATLLLAKRPFTEQEVATIVDMARRGKFTILHAPHPVPADVLEGRSAGAYYRHFVGASAAERAELTASYRRNIAPSTDDWPFFFFMDRFQNVFSPDAGDHPARRLAMPILYFVFLLFAALAVLTVFVPLWLRRDLSIQNVPQRTPMLLYFAGIGVGFMLIEISLIHRLTVFLGHPTYSFVIVLFAILLASGIGSLWSERLSGSRLRWILGLIVALVAVVATTVYDRLTELMWLEFPARVAVSLALLAPIGLLLGMCFPLGIRWARRAHEHLVPWAWAVNGVFSVFAAAASLVIAMNFGLTVMMLVGAACYLANLLILLRVGEAAPQAAAAPVPA